MKSKEFEFGGLTVNGFGVLTSDAALREVAGKYAYDNNEINHEYEGEITLRSGGDIINTGTLYQ